MGYALFWFSNLLSGKEGNYLFRYVPLYLLWDGKNKQRREEEQINVYQDYSQDQRLKGEISTNNTEGQEWKAKAARRRVVLDPYVFSHLGKTSSSIYIIGSRSGMSS